MAQGRILLRSLGNSRKFAAVPGTARSVPAEFIQCLYCLLIPHTDDYGRMSGDAFTVKHAVWSTSERPEADFEEALAALHRVGLVIHYQIAGEWYLQVVKFEDGQPGLRVDRRAAKSRFPDPPAEPLNQSGKCREVPGSAGKEQETPGVPSLREEKGREGKGRELNSSGASAPGEVTAPRPVPLTPKGHKSHAFCWRACVPAFLFQKFRLRLGGVDPDHALSAWMVDVANAWPAEQSIDCDDVTFWEAQFTAWRGGGTGAIKQQAKAARNAAALRQFEEGA